VILLWARRKGKLRCDDDAFLVIVIRAGSRVGVFKLSDFGIQKALQAHSKLFISLPSRICFEMCRLMYDEIREEVASPTCPKGQFGQCLLILTRPAGNSPHLYHVQMPRRALRLVYDTLGSYM